MYLAQVARARAHAGTARVEPVRKYTPTVKRINKNGDADCSEVEGLIREGLFGLFGSSEKYRPERPRVKFSFFPACAFSRK